MNAVHRPLPSSSNLSRFPRCGRHPLATSDRSPGCGVRLRSFMCVSAVARAWGCGRPPHPRSVPPQTGRNSRSSFGQIGSRRLNSLLEEYEANRATTFSLRSLSSVGTSGRSSDIDARPTSSTFTPNILRAGRMRSPDWANWHRSDAGRGGPGSLRISQRVWHVDHR